MYENLRTNFLQEVMGLPFPQAEGSSYPRHDVVLKYLRDYADRFGLRAFIRFGTHVKIVRPVGDAWEVSARDYRAGQERVGTYHAVMVCVGQSAAPEVPALPGIEAFAGTVLHSHDYRRAGPFAGLRVAVLGASASGKDIALELAAVAEKVYLCHGCERLKSALPENVVESAATVGASPGGFALADGAYVGADALVCCAGYRYSFPFLSGGCGVFVRGKRVRPLFKELVNIEKPTMAIVGIPFCAVPFPMFHYQVQYFLKTLRHPSTLPSKEQMYEEEEADFQKKLAIGFPPRHAHKLASLQWDYNEGLARLAGVEPLHPAYRELCELSVDLANRELTTYKQRCHTGVFTERMGRPAASPTLGQPRQYGASHASASV